MKKRLRIRLAGLFLLLMCLVHIAGCTAQEGTLQKVDSSSFSNSQIATMAAQKSNTNKNSGQKNNGKKNTEDKNSEDENSGQIELQILQPEFAESPADNPLKGFTAYLANYPNVPHSLIYLQLPLSLVYDSQGNLNWDAFEAKINQAVSYHCQVVVVFYTTSPSAGETETSNAIPASLQSQVNLITYSDYEGGVMPDYHDPITISFLTDFVEAYAQRYDGDPRIAYIEAGLLGYWGEWHTYPSTQYMASVEDQLKILEAYDNAFNNTWVLMRYPVGNNSGALNIGYYDHYFARETLSVEGETWYFMTRLKNANLQDKWKELPIGGEYMPDNQINFLYEQPWPYEQDYDECVQQTHVTYLAMMKTFDMTLTDPYRIDFLSEQSKKLGYDFRIQQVTGTLQDGTISITCDIANIGIAPIYYNWPPVIRFYNEAGEAVQEITLDWNLMNIASEGNQVYTAELDASALANGSYTIGLEAPNPVEGCPSIRFANDYSGSVSSSVLTLGTLTKQ